jgi:hypothetical protein
MVLSNAYTKTESAAPRSSWRRTHCDLEAPPTFRFRCSWTIRTSRPTEGGTMDIKSKITTLAILAAATRAAHEAQRRVAVCLSDVSLARKVAEVIEARETASDKPLG